MMKNFFITIVVVVSYLANPAYAQNFSGRYLLQSQQTSLTLVLQHDSQGNLTGSLTSSTGATFQLQGSVEEGVGAGIVTGQQGGSYFETEPQGEYLLLTLIEAGAYNQPDYNQVRELMFVRQKGNASKGPAMRQQTPGPPAATVTGQESNLHGRLCSYSGSSSSYGNSSYSSSRWAHFNGQGNFTYGSEGSFSSDSGMYYSGGGQPDGGGTYRVQGNNIVLTFSDGTQGAASVHMRQNSGRITELMYVGTLYATSLCE